MGEGGPHSPDSEGGGAGGTSEESGKGVKSDEGGESGESVRRRPPLKRQITRNQSDPKILPVKIFSRMKLNKIQSIMAPLAGFVRYFQSFEEVEQILARSNWGLSLASWALDKMLPATIHVRFKNHGVYFFKLLKTEEEKRVSGLSGHPSFLFNIFYLGA